MVITVSKSRVRDWEGGLVGPLIAKYQTRHTVQCNDPNKKNLLKRFYILMLQWTFKEQLSTSSDLYSRPKTRSWIHQGLFCHDQVSLGKFLAFFNL